MLAASVHRIIHQVHRKGQQYRTGRHGGAHPVSPAGLFTAQVLAGAALQRVAN